MGYVIIKFIEARAFYVEKIATANRRIEKSN